MSVVTPPSEPNHRNTRERRGGRGYASERSSGKDGCEASASGRSTTRLPESDGLSNLLSPIERVFRALGLAPSSVLIVRTLVGDVHHLGIEGVKIEHRVVSPGVHRQFLPL